jgi:hypothetical protein
LPQVTILPSFGVGVRAQPGDEGVVSPGVAKLAVQEMVSWISRVAVKQRNCRFLIGTRSAGCTGVSFGARLRMRCDYSASITGWR